MSLTLTVTSYQRLSPGQETTKVVDQRGITIGRAPENGWVLPDPERFLSGRHCIIEYRDGAYFITDTSTNGVLINQAEERLGRGNTARLKDGDQLTMGDYEIEVRISQPDELDATSPVRIAGDAHPAQDLGSTPPEDLFGSDWPEPPSDRETKSDHLPPEQEFFRPPAARQELIPEDWDLLEEDQTGRIPPEQSPKPPPAAESQPAPGGPPLAPEAVPTGAADRAALQAFLSGAGVEQLQIPDTELTAFMTSVGEVFRQMVQGMMEVLIARSSLKNEFRLSQTTIRPVENNPLKFSLSVDDAIINLLTKRGTAYLPPQQAVQEGFKDIKAHQLAVMAGMQAALTHLLKRFDPHRLEKRLGQHSALDNILPGHRKARYWDLFNALYEEIVREAEDDFQELFGREFARAYEEQVRKL